MNICVQLAALYTEALSLWTTSAAVLARVGSMATPSHVYVLSPVRPCRYRLAVVLSWTQCSRQTCLRYMACVGVVRCTPAERGVSQGPCCHCTPLTRRLAANTEPAAKRTHSPPQAAEDPKRFSLIDDRAGAAAALRKSLTKRGIDLSCPHRQTRTKAP
jgi:hypothetical protein